MNRQSRFDAGYRKLGADLLGWPRGMVWGGRWEGGFRMGNTCTPVADACWCMAKPIQYCKVEKKKTLLMVTAAMKSKDTLLLRIKVMTNLDILKCRNSTFPTKVCLVKAMIFPVVIYGCEFWTIKKAECRRIDAFELWCGEDSWESLGLQVDPTSPS